MFCKHVLPSVTYVNLLMQLGCSHMSVHAVCMNFAIKMNFNYTVVRISSPEVSQKFQLIKVAKMHPNHFGGNIRHWKETTVNEYLHRSTRP